MSNKTVHVATAVNDDYALPLSVMIKSASVNTPSQIKFYIFTSDLTTKNQNKIESNLNSNASVQFIIVDASEFEGFFTVGLSAETYFRFLIPKYLKDLERVLYLDADLLILKSLIEVFSFDLQDNAVGAVIEPWAEKDHIAILNPEKTNYFNAGVMLFNLSKINSGDSNEWFHFAKNHQNKIKYWDQDVLNWYYVKFSIFPIKYNLMSRFFLLKEQILENGTCDKFELEAAFKQPVIIHYNMAFWKPWVVKCKHPKKWVYARYLWMTPWWHLVFKLIFGRMFLRFRKIAINR